MVVLLLAETYFERDSATAIVSRFQTRLSK